MIESNLTSTKLDSIVRDKTPCKYLQDTPNSQQKTKLKEPSLKEASPRKEKRKLTTKDFAGNYDTIVQCSKCGKKQLLNFVNGLKNGWSKCCGYTMPIIFCEADIDAAVKSLSIKVEKVGVSSE